MKPITQQLKRFSDDERAVSPVVGFVLIFALIMIVFTMYQASVVPAQNEEVEFKHSQAVVGDMSRLNDAMDQAGASGISQSATIDTGVQYPDRALAINPGAPAGTLKTSSDPSGNPYMVKIENVKATGENAEYFDSSNSPNPFQFESKELIYGISYNVYQQDPTIVITPGLQFAEFQDGSVVQSTSIITGNTIDLTLLDTDSGYQQSAMTTSIDVTPTSTAAEYMTIEPDGGNPKIVIKTSLSLDPTTATNFENMLMSENNKVTSATYTLGNPSTVTLTLKPETYEFRVSEVGIGTATPRPSHYLTSDTPTRQTISLGESATFTVVARDELGNPVSNADIIAEINDTSTATGTFQTGTDTATATTNDEGRATFEFRAKTVTDDPIKVDVRLDGGGGGTKLSKVTYTIEADTRYGFIDNGYKVDVLIESVALDGDQLEIVFQNNRVKDVTATTMQLNGFLSKKNKQVNSATLGGTTIPFNEGPVALGGDSFTVPASGTNTITLDLDERPNGVGLLIIDVTFETSDGRTIVATYATSIS
ncbi:MAG TPA: hypothetical protein VFJ06_10995 [Halococcus sp.]|nr:hypothetical protein [Halococcus sp.]